MARTPGPSPLRGAPLSTVLAILHSNGRVRSAAAAIHRLDRVGANPLTFGPHTAPLTLLLRQFLSPFILIRLGAALLSFALDSITVGEIILVIVVVSGRLGFWQDNGAAQAVQTLLAVLVVAALLLAWTPQGRLFGFMPLPPLVLGLVGANLVAYVVTAEVVKRWFDRGLKSAPERRCRHGLGHPWAPRFGSSPQTGRSAVRGGEGRTRWYGCPDPQRPMAGRQ